jgi:adenylosuccinate synthase
MPTSVVIDLGFGDSGKGVVTDFLSHFSFDTIVVRFSGGQQAGHNVVIDEKSHIHSNFASGALAGYPSYFSEHTSFYLNTLSVEKVALMDKGGSTELYIHPLAKVTTPYDVAYNRALELTKNHGSCGLGIAATHKRNEAGYKLHTIDLMHNELFEKKLRQIALYYNEKVMLEGLNIEVYKNYLNQNLRIFKHLAKHYLDYLQMKDYQLLRDFKDVVFEGSQGIMLDMDHGIFPNVTWGNTTSKNAIEICMKTGLEVPHVYYVTRCYSTRHGVGWMPNEGGVVLVNAVEPTNTNNEWQKEFRVGELDYELLKYAIMVDTIYSDMCRKSLVVTCLDHRPGYDFDYDQFAGLFFATYESRSPNSRFMKPLPSNKLSTV